MRVNQDGSKRNAFELLSFPDISFKQLSEALPELESLSTEIAEQLSRDALYANYIARQDQDVAAMKRDEHWEIPEGFDYGALPGLSTELKMKLTRVQPRTLAQAGRVDGVTPAALTLILARLRRANAERRA